MPERMLTQLPVHGTPLRCDRGAEDTREACYATRPGVGCLPTGTRRLLDLLGNLLSIRYSGSVEERCIDGEIVFTQGNHCEKLASPAGGRLTVPAAMDGAESRRPQIEQIRFADETEVPAPFRGRVLRTSVHAALAPLHPRKDEAVLASCGGQAIWVAQRGARAPHYRSALPLPALQAGQGFSDAFGAERFLDLLPLLHFLRRTAADEPYSLPELRASFMLDDPNLHWPRYGCVDYRAIVEHACRHRYHVSIATIPLDGWYTHPATAELFRRHPHRLSLTIHGNNHAKRELAACCEPERRRMLLQQALHRIERLERAAGVHVCRVMVPPHGACSAATLAALPALGYEAACLSAGSLRASNPQQPWTAGVGYWPADVVEGCTVLPRWSLTSGIQNVILVAAYLGQPIILRAHQQDLRRGVEVLDEAALAINALGDVTWSTVTDLSRRSYLSRLDGPLWRVKPYASTVRVTPPPGASELQIQEPNGNGESRWLATSGAGERLSLQDGRMRLRPEDAGRPFILTRAQVRERAPAGRVWTSPGLLLRRALTETRDRLSGI